MEPISIPSAVLAFLLALGCNPTREVYEVDKILVDGVETLGIYCPIVKEPYCPVAKAVLIERGVMDTGVLVHELWHSCQLPAYDNWQRTVNERQAKSIEKYWRDRD